MEEKISCMAVVDAWGTQNTLKCRTKRGVTSLRPPPGGAAPVMSIVSAISFQKSLSRS